MAHDLTPTATFTAPVTVPDDGDGLAAITIENPISALANRSEYNFARAHARNRAMIAMGQIAPVAFASLTGPTVAGWVQANAASAGLLHFGIDTKPGDAVQQLIAYVHGDPTGVGPHAALPATLPQIQAISYNYATGVRTVLGTLQDSPADVPAYESFHLIALSGLAYAMAPQEALYLDVAGETGADSINGAFHILGVEAVITAI